MKERPLVILLQTAGLSAFAIAQPLLQLLGQSPEFLTIHDASAVDVLLLSLTLLLVPPIVLSGFVIGAGAIHAASKLLVQSLVVGVLSAVILLPVVDRTSAVHGWPTILIAATGGGATAYVFWSRPWFQKYLTYLAAAVPIFLAVFLGSAPIRALLLPGPPYEAAIRHQSTVPVVLVVFDELPSASLMRPDLTLDRDLFPNFARLMDTSTWYRDATSIAPSTVISVPAILTGQFPTKGATPSLADYPLNLFTLLGASHRVSALESATRLCPEALSARDPGPLSDRLRVLFDDMFVVYQHIVVPRSFHSSLVPISNGWRDYRGVALQHGVRRGPATKFEEFEAFVGSLTGGEQPNLIVAHPTIPHHPWNFSPSGKLYRDPMRDSPDWPHGHWPADRVVVEQSYRRHLFQAMAADKLLGQLLDRIQHLDLFRDAIVIVTADHGITFQPEVHPRFMTKESAGDVMPVPLFVKYPGQTEGVVDDRLAQTVDIMPTLVDVLEIDSGWHFDGVSLRSPAGGDRQILDFFDWEVLVHQKVSPEILERRGRTAEWKQLLIGSRDGERGLVGMGDLHRLVGRRVSDFETTDRPDLIARIQADLELSDFEGDEGFALAEIIGTVEGFEGEGRLRLALAYEGRIVGTSETYLKGPEPGVLDWEITTAFDALRPGDNHPELFTVDAGVSGPVLSRIPQFTPSFMGVNLGGLHVAGVRETGLFASHDWDGQWSRWTNGHGRWKIPVKRNETPSELILEIISSGPDGTHLTVTANGTEILESKLPRGAWRTRLPFSGIDIENSLTIVLDSDVFVPAKEMSNTDDHRQLGVSVTTLMVNE